jgi:hypothetical protein
MAVRVNAPEVKQVFGDTSVSDDDIALLVDIASRHVDDVLSSTTLTAGTLKDIELYLAAHLLALRTGNFSRRKVNDSEDEYALKTGEGLKSTRFGQQAISLDTSGKLAALGTTRARFRVYP